jgi:UDP-glucose 4-epimerase
MRILVTGAATWTGGRLIQRLERRPDVTVFAVDELEPVLAFDAEFQKTSLDRLELAHYVIDTAPDVVVHLQTVDRSAVLGKARAHEESVLGAQALFGAIARTSSVGHVIVKSDSAFYGAGPRNPSVLAETTKTHGQPDPYQRDLVAMEGFVEKVAESNPDTTFTVLRFASIVGPTLGNPLSRYLMLPGVPTLLGYDPRMQVIHEDDAVGALEHAVDHKTTGTINVAAPGQLYLSRMLRLGLRVPQPLPKRAWKRTIRALGRFGIHMTEPLTALLQHGRVMDVRRMQDHLGFRPSLTCRQTILSVYGRLPDSEEAAAG